MSAAIAGAMIFGTAMNIVGQRKAAKAEAAAARANAARKREQAEEVLTRFEMNRQQTLEQGEVIKGQQRVSFASKGIDISSGSALSVIEETNAMTTRQVMQDRREAYFKADQLRKGADIDQRLAGDIRTASRYSQLGTFFSGAGLAYKSY